MPSCRQVFTCLILLSHPEETNQGWSSLSQPSSPTMGSQSRISTLYHVRRDTQAIVEATDTWKTSMYARMQGHLHLSVPISIFFSASDDEGTASLKPLTTQ